MLTPTHREHPAHRCRAPLPSPTTRPGAEGPPVETPQPPAARHRWVTGDGTRPASQSPAAARRLVAHLVTRLGACAQVAQVAMEVCVVGDVIEEHANDSTLRGHGTQLRHGSLVASRCGAPQRWSQLTLVQPLAGAYSPAVGHIVVGRVAQVPCRVRHSPRW